MTGSILCTVITIKILIKKFYLSYIMYQALLPFPIQN